MRKWIVKVPAGFWMAGLHRFKTRRAASDFARRWQAADLAARGSMLALAVYREA